MAYDETLVNPMRDIGSAVDDDGSTPASLSMAPTLAEAWPWIARRIDGCVIVAGDLPLALNMIGRDLQATGVMANLGFGINTGEVVMRDANRDASRASCATPTLSQCRPLNGHLVGDATHGAVVGDTPYRTRSAPTTSPISK